MALFRFPSVSEMAGNPVELLKELTSIADIYDVSAVSVVMFFVDNQHAKSYQRGLKTKDFAIAARLIGQHSRITKTSH